MRHAVVIESADSNFSAYVPDLPGCAATGRTVAETEDAMRNAIGFTSTDYVRMACRLRLL
jgi:predicted RNase H-like HicB family nuclease